MSSTLTISELKQRVNIVDVIGKYLSLKKRGIEYEAMCPFHNDHNASLKVNEKKQIFKCFADGVGGDVLDFLQLYPPGKGRSMDEAIKELEQLAGEVRPARPVDEWRQARPKDEIAFQIDHYKHGKPAQVWRYADERNQLIGFVCRFNLPGGKEVIPFTLCENIRTGRKEWRWHGFDAPRSLYNLQELKKRPTDIVLLVEGEKTCDAAKKHFPELVCTTWQGGARAIDKTDWSPLKGRNVITWSDNDAPGFEAMKLIATKLAQPCRQVIVPPGLPVHWDLADSIPEDIHLSYKEILKSNLYKM